MDLYLTAIGDKNQEYYITIFEEFDDQGDGLKVSWNWSAFLFTGVWALYRRMYGWFVMWWVVATILVVFEKSQNAQMNQTLALVVGVLWLGFGAFPNALYHRKVRARIAAAQRASADAARVIKRLRIGGGVHAWVPIAFGGVPLIGVVAAVALPAYQDYTKRQVDATKAFDPSTAKLDLAESGPVMGQFGGTLANKAAGAPGAPSNPTTDTKLVSPDDPEAARERGDYVAALRIWSARAEQSRAGQCECTSQPGCNVQPWPWCGTGLRRSGQVVSLGGIAR
jgi:hypothetical protein